MPDQTRPDLPVLDLAVHTQTASHLSAASVASYLDIIADLGTSLLAGLRATDPAADGGGPEKWVDLAHAVAGSAGMFGYLRAAALAQSFEHAVQTGSAAWPARASDLAHALDATLADIAARRA